MAARVCVVGAGAAGLATARALQGARCRVSVDVVEQSSWVGGTWCTRNPTSVLYDSLRTNLPTELMAFPGEPFPAGLPSFVGHKEVLVYLETYAEEALKDATPLFGHTVKSVRRGDDGWEVESEGAVTGTRTASYDYVAIANGHFSVPHIPCIPGSSSWERPAVHAAAYRTPRAPDLFVDQRVTVVGGGPSGVDIAIDLLSVASEVRMVCRDSQARRMQDRVPDVVPVWPEMVGMDKTETIHSDGSVRDTTDVIVWATGYRYEAPFLADCGVVDCAGSHIAPLFMHMFPVRDPSLVLMGLPFKVVPFPLFEAQARLFVRSIDDPAVLPPAPARQAAWEEDMRCVDDPRHTHLMEDWDLYLRELAVMAGDDPAYLHLEGMRRMYDDVAARRLQDPEGYRDTRYPPLSQY